MNPGIDLDVLVLEKVMGWSREGGALTRYWHDETGASCQFISPSTDIECAFRVLEGNAWTQRRRLSSAAGNDYQICRAYPQTDRYLVAYMTPTGGKQGPEGDSVPHAICLAALEAFGVTV